MSEDVEIEQPQRMDMDSSDDANANAIPNTTPNANANTSPIAVNADASNNIEDAPNAEADADAASAPPTALAMEPKMTSNVNQNMNSTTVSTTLTRSPSYGTENESMSFSISPSSSTKTQLQIKAKASSTKIPPSTTTRSQFLHHTLSLYTLQILREAGFTSVSKNALAILTHVLQCYIEEVGRRSKQLAETSCRQYINLYDVVTVLHQFNQPLSSLMRYVIKGDSLPFLYHIGAFPRPSPPSSSVSKSDDIASSASGSTSTTSSTSDLPLNPLLSSSSPATATYYPPYLPPFPPPHTYIKNIAYPEQPTTTLPPALFSRMKKLAARRAVEEGLIRFREASETADKIKESNESLADTIMTPDVSTTPALDTHIRATTISAAIPNGNSRAPNHDSVKMEIS